MGCWATQVDWQAVAILVTGLLAVGAAYFVGQRQAEIQSHQADIQEAALRSDLFDRRYKVFEAAEQFLREIIQHADDPSPETQRAFVVVIGESRFLFLPPVRDGLDEIWKKWTAFHVLKVTMRHLFQTEQHYGDGNPEKEGVALAWFAERFSTLPELFDELKLGGVLPPS